MHEAGEQFCEWGPKSVSKCLDRVKTLHKEQQSAGLHKQPMRDKENIAHGFTARPAARHDGK